MPTQPPTPHVPRVPKERGTPRFTDASWADFWRRRGWKAPDKAGWLDPRQDRRFLLYAASLRDKFGFVRFVGLPTQGGPEDTPIEKLYVEPALSAERIDPNRTAVDWPETSPLIDAVIDHPRLVVLGDPGSGKSSLVSWIVLSLLSRDRNRLKDTVGPLVPVTLVLRDLTIEGLPTWEKLLARFIAHPSGQALGSPDQIESYLQRGQAMVLVDGLDEAGETQVRKAVVEALRGAFDRYPSVRWIVTSRVVGYDEAAVDTAPMSMEIAMQAAMSFHGAEHMSWPVEPVADRLYVAPFDDARIGMFVRNWHEQHEPDRAERSARSAELIEAIDRSPQVKGLARIPNLLTMIALVYRIYLRLPDGRALLYERIAQAYLETIETARKLPTLGHTLEDMKRWLGYAAFQMQRARFRIRNAGPEEHGILVSREQLTGWIVFAIARGNKEAVEQHRSTALAFVDWAARRAGLIIPRSEDLFAFAHLSFQEYFAAWFIAEQVTSAAWIRKGRGSSPLSDGADLTTLQEACGDPRWHETLILLFELLGVRGEWSDEVLEQLLSPTDDRASAAPAAIELLPGFASTPRESLIIQLARDQHSGLSAMVRQHCYRRAWQTVGALSDAMFTRHQFHGIPWLVDELLDPEGGRTEAAWDALFAKPIILRSFVWARGGDSAAHYLSKPSDATASLRQVFLGRELTDSGLMEMARNDTGLNGLTELYLYSPYVTNAGIRYLAHADTGLKRLTTLYIQCKQFGDAELKELARADTGLSALKTLGIGWSRVTDAGLLELARADTGLKALTTLIVESPHITEAGLEAVKARWPGIQVIEIPRDVNG